MQFILSPSLKFSYFHSNTLIPAYIQTYIGMYQLYHVYYAG